jgi:Protein of unknown function (DUF3347)
MKRSFFAAITAATLVLSACNSEQSNNHEGHDMTTEKESSAPHATAEDKQALKTVNIAFTGLDAGVSSAIKQIVDHYLHLKNALAGENATEAASGAKAMIESIGKLDKSMLTADQKTAYDKEETNLKEHAGHIAKNGSDITAQRSHFVQLSVAVYELVKHFGGGRPLYHDHCPMARDNQGAMWISETKEISNPYFGDKMLTCGRVEEVIQ